MNIKLQMNNIILYLYLLMVLRLYEVNGKELVQLRESTQYKNENDNTKLIQLLESKNDVVLKEIIKIELGSWKAMNVKNKRIKGNGFNSKIEIHVDNAVSLNLFNNLLNCDLYNITIEIFSKNKEIEIESGLINKIEKSRIRKLHLIVNKRIILSGDNGLNGLISNRIINSEINDIGVLFSEITIIYSSQNIWCLISCELSDNGNNVYYNGIFVKGKTVIMEITDGRLLYIGFLVYSSTNINYNYVVVDIENVKLIGNSPFHFCFFIYESATDIEINYLMIVIRNKLIYEDEESSLHNMILSGIMNENSVYKTLKLNHYLFDIHVDTIKIVFTEPKYKSEKREFTINGICKNNLGKIIANYVQVRLYFNDMYTRIKDRLCSVNFSGVHYCKTVMSANLLVDYTGGDISLNNSYFNVEKRRDKEVSNIYVYTSLVETNDIVVNTYMTDPDDIVANKRAIFSGSVNSVYLKLKNLNYKKNELLIYDSSMPYYNYSSNCINYDIFLKEIKSEKYEYGRIVTNIKNNLFIFIYVIIVVIMIILVLVFYYKYDNNGYVQISVDENK